MKHKRVNDEQVGSKKLVGKWYHPSSAAEARPNLFDPTYCSRDVLDGGWEDGVKGDESDGSEGWDEGWE